MKNQTKKNYDYYIQKAIDGIQECEEYNLVPHNIEKVLKKQANKRLLEKIGELKEQIDLKYAKGDQEWELKHGKHSLNTPPVRVVTFHVLLSDMLFYDMEVYHRLYTEIYQHVCERVQASKNQRFLESRSSVELETIFNNVPPEKIYDAVVGFEKIADLLYEYKATH